MSDDANVQLTTDLCRGLVLPGPDGNRLNVSTPVGDCLVTLETAESMASVEVAYRAAELGSALDRTAFRPILVIIAIEGRVQISHDTQETSLALGEGIAMVAGEPLKTFKLKNIPQWFRASYERPIDHMAAEDLAKWLDGNVDAELRQLAGHRRPETAALALQTLLLSGRWQLFGGDWLKQARMRTHWDRTLILARQLIAANPADAEQAQSALAAASPQGLEHFRLLCGLSESELSAGGGLALLVGLLDDNDLATRVVASHHLRNLTGKDLGYQAHAPNRASIQTWRRELAMNQLKIDPVKDIIWERTTR